MGVSVLIQSTLRNPVTGLEGVSITKALRSIPTCTIRTKDPTGAYLPAVGNQVEIQDGGVLFGGSIEEVERLRRNTNIALLETNISCVGFADRLENRLAPEFELNGATGGALILYIGYASLTGDITDFSLVETGPVVDKFVSTYPTVREAIETICALTGYEYYIQPDGKLAYFSPASHAAPFSVTTGANCLKLTTRETREDFCNYAIAHVSNLLRDPASETFIGDGSTKSWNVAYPISSAPTIFVGSPSVEQTIGIAGVDTGKDFYWSDGSTEIRQDDGAAAIGSGINIDVTFVGIESVYVSSSSLASITARATAENNSGRYEKLIKIDQRLTRADAQDIVDAYVSRHSQLSLVLTIETDTLLEPLLLDIEPGQVLTVSLTGWNAAGNYLVRSVGLQMRKGDQDEGRWTGRIEAISGPVLRNYIDVFRNLTGGGGSVSGSASIAGGSGGAGVYLYEPAKLTAATMITSPIACTAGARLTVYVTQGASPWTISFSSDFKQVMNTNISAVEDDVSVFDFTGRSDGLWWPSGFSMTGLS